MSQVPMAIQRCRTITLHPATANGRAAVFFRGSFFRGGPPIR
jgi:hypothetical protein